jgi:hypothetical protein
MTDQKTINDIIEQLDRSGKREWADCVRGMMVQKDELITFIDYARTDHKGTKFACVESRAGSMLFVPQCVNEAI